MRTKTSSERNRQFVERLKSTGQYEAYKKKIASKRKIRNDSRINSIKSLPESVQQKIFREQREYARKKVAKCRARKKQLLSATSTQYALNTLTTSSTSSTRGYNSSSALNKAVAKLKRAAPKSLEKKKEAVRELLLSFDVKDREEIILGTTENSFRKTNALSPSVIKSVQGFYERDDVSRMSPNVKDCKNYVNSVTGVKQTRYLMYKVSEVYNMYLKEFRQENDSTMAPLKATKFYKLRPDHVKLVRDTPLETCLCIYHSATHRCLNEFETDSDEVKTEDEKISDLQIDFAEGIKCEVHEEIQAIHEIQKFRRCLNEFEKDSDEVKTENEKISDLQIDFAEGIKCEEHEEIQAAAYWNQATM